MSKGGICSSCYRPTCFWAFVAVHCTMAFMSILTLLSFDSTCGHADCSCLRVEQEENLWTATSPVLPICQGKAVISQSLRLSFFAATLLVKHFCGTVALHYSLHGCFLYLFVFLYCFFQTCKMLTEAEKEEQQKKEDLACTDGAAWVAEVQEWATRGKCSYYYFLFSHTSFLLNWILQTLH